MNASDRSGRDTTPAGTTPRTARDVLDTTSLSALVLDVPQGRIAAASAGATRLLRPAGGTVVGRLLEEFTADQAVLGPDVFAGGRLDGFETSRVLKRSGSHERVRMWIRSYDGQVPPTSVVVVFADAAPAKLPGPDSSAIYGAFDESLLITRISSEAREVLAATTDELIGRSVLSLIAPGDLPRCLTALGEACAGRAAVSVRLDLLSGAQGLPVRCEVLMLPSAPPPSCDFVVLPIVPDPRTPEDSRELAQVLERLARGAALARHTHGRFNGATETSTPGLSRLTTRELEVVGLLLGGDRPPAIAGKLFLTQSTIRNHLGSVFAKLGVSSQQELVDLFRVPVSEGGE